MSINDYKPISLLNSSIKPMTKILANRLQNDILRVIHQNQYGFIKSKSIQDCLGRSFEYTPSNLGRCYIILHISLNIYLTFTLTLIIHLIQKIKVMKKSNIYLNYII
jgi:hypothetical protein